jgi:hypothetical protein
MTEISLASWSSLHERTGRRPVLALDTLATAAYRPITAIDSSPMPPLTLLASACLLLGLALLGAGAAWMRAIGANMALGRRLAGAREIPVGEASRLNSSSPRPLRVTGRIRCPDPLVTPDGERLVAFHRDVEVRTPRGGWRAIERLRETRSFEIWDHAGSMGLDPADAAEPLITIPLVWEGRTDELGGELSGAVARVAQEQGQPDAARAVTRTISEVDRIQVLARIRADESTTAALEPPPGGFVISALELDPAMRLLGGEHRRQLAIAIGVLAVGGAILVGGILVLLGALFAGH